ncbi:hypothetical protein AVEN_183907-1 [Araneus ventricosus]|uniref:Uncharacterized protein n=1 Tax=Araneus ventricosus TaxID=182803 RepID=A0A4Y2V3A1_ARAVE|nr:hypothetical protein AVEN_183907-1 [Araneus ventricosus]
MERRLPVPAVVRKTEGAISCGVSLLIRGGKFYRCCGENLSAELRAGQVVSKSRWHRAMGSSSISDSTEDPPCVWARSARLISNWPNTLKLVCKNFERELPARLSSSSLSVINRDNAKK